MDRGFAKSRPSRFSLGERIPRSIGHFGRIRGTRPLTKRVPTFEGGMFGSASVVEFEVPLQRAGHDPQMTPR
jgi:hypothetical protein